MYIQKVTYWEYQGVGAEGTIYGAPIIFNGRWEELSEAFLSKAGEQEISNAIVFCPIPVKVDGYLFKGTSTETDPRGIVDAYKIRQRIMIPDLRNIKSEYRAIL